MRNIFDKSFDCINNLRNEGIINGSLHSIKDEFNDVKENVTSVKNFFSHDYRYNTDKLIPGDILSVSRLLPYLHIGVYVGDNKVIHFAGDDGDFKGRNTIHEAPIEEFLQSHQKFEVLHFEERRKESLRIFDCLYSPLSLPKLYNEWEEHQRNQQYHLYTPEETVKRAKKIAEDWKKGNQKKYNLAFNNCEHFAIWCKTGIGESKQVDRVFRLFNLPIKQKYFTLDSLQRNRNNNAFVNTISNLSII